MRLADKNVVTLSLAAGVLFWVNAQAEVDYREQSGDVIKVLVSDDAWQPDHFKQAILIPAAYAVEAEIFLDGVENEPAWTAAEEVTVPLSFGSVRFAQLKALYTDEDVLLRVRWADTTEDRLHHPWVWDEELGKYLPGPQVEDSLMLSFEAGCEWFPSFLAGYAFDFDAWQWLAGRTDPLGQALDLSGSMKDQELSDTTSYASRNGEDEWNLKFNDRNDGILHKPWDQLDRQYMIWPVIDNVFYHDWLDGSRGREFTRQLLPPESLPSSPAAMLPQFEPFALEGNAGDVRAKGHWEDGYWTVELRRKRITEGGTAWDVQFDRLTQFSLHVFDHAERLDQSSESQRLFLQFLEKEPAPEPILASE